jgi:hypothetical protein
MHEVSGEHVKHFHHDAEATERDIKDNMTQ